MTGFTLDATDCRILAVLQEDGRISNLDLAERISLSPSACLCRMPLLEEEGVIASYRACLDRERLGIELEAFVHVSMRNDEENWHEKFAAAVRKWPEVVGVRRHRRYALRAAGTRAQPQALLDFILSKLYKAPGVIDIRSNIVRQTMKDDAGVPVTLIEQPGRAHTP